jgi:cytochrome c-type biogenesis protein CcmF
MGDYELTYRGNAYEVEGFPIYVKKEFLFPTEDPFRMIVTTGDLVYKDKVYHKRGDTINVRPENTYYAIEYKSSKGDTFLLYPRAQVNPSMGLLASPDIKRFVGKDLYTHVSSIPKPEEEHEWSAMEEHKAKVGDTLFLNDYVAQLVTVRKLDPTIDKEFGKFDAGVKVIVRILGKDQVFIAEPSFIIRGNEIAQTPQELGELGIRISLNNIEPNPDPTLTVFTLGVSTSQRDWVIMKAVEKPFINLLWLGTFVLVIGFLIAIRRRYQDFVKMRNKGLDWV